MDKEQKGHKKRKKESYMNKLIPGKDNADLSTMRVRSFININRQASNYWVLWMCVMLSTKFGQMVCLDPPSCLFAKFFVIIDLIIRH